MNFRPTEFLRTTSIGVNMPAGTNSFRASPSWPTGPDVRHFRGSARTAHDSLASLVDRCDPVCFNGHQLYRPPNAVTSCSVFEAGLPLEQHRLCQHRCGVPRGLLYWPNLMRKINGSIGHKTRADTYGTVVLSCFDAHAASERFSQFRRISISSRGCGIG